MSIVVVFFFFGFFCCFLLFFSIQICFYYISCVFGAIVMLKNEAIASEIFSI